MLLVGCRSVKLAERRVRRIAYDYPELVQVRAHTIDTFFAVPVKADIASLPMRYIETGSTVKKETPSGKFTVQLDGDSLMVAYTSAADTIRFRDTLHYAQVVVGSGTKEKARRKTMTGALIAFGFLVVGSLFSSVLIKQKNK